MTDLCDLPLFESLAANVPLNFRAPGTSARAARSASRYAGPTFVAILEALRTRPMTPDEVARVIGKSILSTRPRFSDLAHPRDQTGARIPPFIIRTGEERSTDSGSAADVYRLTSPQERTNWKPSDPVGEAG